MIAVVTDDIEKPLSRAFLTHLRSSEYRPAMLDLLYRLHDGIGAEAPEFDEAAELAAHVLYGLTVAASAGDLDALRKTYKALAPSLDRDDDAKAVIPFDRRVHNHHAMRPSSLAKGLRQTIDDLIEEGTGIRAIATNAARFLAPPIMGGHVSNSWSDERREAAILAAIKTIEPIEGMDEKITIACMKALKVEGADNLFKSEGMFATRDRKKRKTAPKPRSK